MTSDEAYLDLTQLAQERLAAMSVAKRESLFTDAKAASFLLGNQEEMDNEYYSLAIDYIQITHHTTRDILLFVAAEIVSQVRASILKELGYTCSAGIASNKTLAKLVSAMHKPNLQTVLCSAQVESFMGTLPYSKIRGLGGKTGAEIEAKFGGETAGELWKYSLADMQHGLGESTGTWLYHIVRGHCTEEGC